MVYRPNQDYPIYWNKLRWHLFKKYGYRCQLCGRYARGNLHLHHKRPVKMGGSHSEGNLVILCGDCHYNVHAKRIKLAI